MPKHPQPEGVSAEVAAEMGYRLAQVDRRMCSKAVRSRLLVNKKGRVPPKYPIVPSFCKVRFWDGGGWSDKDPQGTGRWHKGSAKAKSTMSSRSRGRK